MFFFKKKLYYRSCHGVLPQLNLRLALGVCARRWRRSAAESQVSVIQHTVTEEKKKTNL